MSTLQSYQRIIPNQTSQDMPYDVSYAMQQMVNQYNQQYGAAKAANEARYQQLLQIADQTTGQRAADITTDYGKLAAQKQQSLARLGMSNTTIGSTLATGVEREKQSSLNRLADEMQQTKLGIIERRTDEYPDLASLQSIIAGMGSQYGSSGMTALAQALSSLGAGSTSAVASPAASTYSRGQYGTSSVASFR